MSESLYRGISKADGFWVYGAYCQHGDRGFIVNVGIDSVGPIAHVTEVHPETVGQFTGQYDATKWEELSPLEQENFFKDQWCGKRIFEGDILEAHYDKQHPEDVARTVVVWRDNGYDHRASGIGWYIEQKPYFGDPFDKFDCSFNKVAGNIYQHKHLLEEGTGWE